MGTQAPVPTEFRTAVRANAAFCGVSGLATAGLAGRLPDILGVGSASFYLVLGLGLVVYAVHLALTARRERGGRLEGILIVAGDAAWVLASVAVVAAGMLSATGSWIVLAVAAVVGAFALWQWRALALDDREGDA